MLHKMFKYIKERGDKINNKIFNYNSVKAMDSWLQLHPENIIRHTGSRCDL